MQLKMFKDLFSTNDPDVVFTPPHIAKDMCERFSMEGVGLDPCCGEGIFLKYLPESTEWCEIRKGVDFFDRTRPVDWIIGNPPYSIFSDWFSHSFALSNNIIYLIPINKLFGSWNKVQSVRNYGGIPTIRFYGSGRDIGFPFGFACGAVHFQKGYSGATNFEYYQSN